MVWYAGWADKLAQVLGSVEPGRRARTSTSPCPSRPASSASSRPRTPALAGLVSRIAPAIVGGNTVVAVASESKPLAAVELAEALATSDLPGGVVNILTGFKGELAPWLAGHMDVNAIDVGGADGQVAELESLAAENVKRVVHGAADGQSLWEIAAFLELKTVWHPIGPDSISSYVTGSRRLSQALAEGDGISVLVHVADADAASAAEGQGAEGLVVDRPGGGLREATALPLLFRGESPDEARGRPVRTPGC